VCREIDVFIFSPRPVKIPITHRIGIRHIIIIIIIVVRLSARGFIIFLSKMCRIIFYTSHTPRHDRGPSGEVLYIIPIYRVYLYIIYIYIVTKGRHRVVYTTRMCIYIYVVQAAVEIVGLMIYIILYT